MKHDLYNRHWFFSQKNKSTCRSFQNRIQVLSDVKVSCFFFSVPSWSQDNCQQAEGENSSQQKKRKMSSFHYCSFCQRRKYCLRNELWDFLSWAIGLNCPNCQGKEEVCIKLLLKEAASGPQGRGPEWQVESVWSGSSCWHCEHWWPCNVFFVELVHERYLEIQGWCFQIYWLVSGTTLSNMLTISHNF